MKKGNVIGIDLGGTKLAAGVVTPEGKIIVERKVATHLKDGWPGLKKQILGICRELQSTQKIRAVGIGSAGPLHGPSGTLLDPTNFGWKKAKRIPLTRELHTALKIPVFLDNDAATAILAECWKGKSGANSLVITLGTGLGVGVIADGKLVRGGRAFTLKAVTSYFAMGTQLPSAAAGIAGCAEAFLSGKNFAARASRLLNKPGWDGVELTKRARGGDKRVLRLFEEYSELLALFLLNLVVLYYPENVVFTGSFAEAQDLFLPLTKRRLRSLLRRRMKTIPILPRLSVSPLGNRAGILGGAFLAMPRVISD